MIADAPARRPLIPHGGDDCVDTPDDLAELIVAHFMPTGRVLEPCRGGGAFVRALTGAGCDCEYCEIKEGIDFLTIEGHWDWVITNPPFSKFRAFLKKSMHVTDNIVFLSLTNAWFMKARQSDIKAEGFGLAEILHVPTPAKPWPQFGICLGVGWLRRGWRGSTWIHSVSEPSPSGAGPRHRPPTSQLRAVNVGDQAT